MSRAGPERGRNARPTIHEVAALSGVSKSTVSNVLRGSGRVAPTTRARVLEAIETLGYRPNDLARTLVRRRSNFIGLVVGDLANTFYAELVKLVERHAAGSGYHTLLCNTDSRADREAASVEILLQHRVRGVVMLQFSGDRAILEQLEEAGLPVVVVSCWEETATCVAVDDAGGMSLAAEHLASLGHRHVGYVSGPLIEPATASARRAGFERAARALGLDTSPELTWAWERPADTLSSSRALRRLLDAPHVPTAFVCANDLLAVQVMEELVRLGRDVPGDVSVLGFDGTDLGALPRIGLTTIAQPRGDLAAWGMRLMLERLDAVTEPEAQHVQLEPELVIRRSTAPPRGLV